MTIYILFIITMTTKNSQTSFTFSFKDWKAELKRYSNPISWFDCLALALSYTSKSWFEKVSIFQASNIDDLKLSSLFDLLSVSISASQVNTVLSGYNFVVEDNNGEMINRVQEPLYAWIRKVR